MKTRISEAIRVLDYVNAFILLGFCFFSFAYVDLILSGFYSLALLKGHILDWYDYNNNVTNNYLMSTYALMGLWQYIPFKFMNYDPVGAIANGMVLWLKAEMLLFGALTGLTIKKIVEEMGYDRWTGNISAFFWFTTPFAVFSLLIFSQMDIFTLFFMMLGFLYYIRGRLLLFSLLFGISITFKYFPIVAFLPLLALVEKRLLRIAGYLVVFILPAALEVYLYKDSAMFQEVFFWGSAASGKLFNATISGTLIHVYPLLWGLTAALAYWLDVKDRRDAFHYWALYLPLLAFIPVFMLIDWYPQWFMVMTPFLALTTLYQKEIRFFIVMELVAYYFFIAYIVYYFPSEVDGNMFLHGGMGVYGFAELWRPMKHYFLFKERSWNFTAISAALFVQLLFKFPYQYFFSNLKHEFRLRMDVFTLDHLRARMFWGVMIFCGPAILSLRRPNPPVLLTAILLFPLLQWILIYISQNSSQMRKRFPAVSWLFEPA